MAGIFRTIYDWLLRMFWATEMDVTMIGLQNAGKSSLLPGIWEASRAFGPCGNGTVEGSTPSCMSDLRLTRLAVMLIGAYHRYIVDAADRAALPVATEELHELMSKPSLEGIPLLVLGNKSDLPDKLSVDELIDAMDLKSINRREVSCYGISAKEETNLDAVLHWLIARANR
ncbi:ADP-ribosylation factor family protein [Rasamsonia emersonii CBS 393.64]|uniref:ADP-ribosylation factor family protein n=1 Tax=Rasamsonia emersonii (strain ATCC 16479 / CBS 393.64 / IMI 116815) TaxID=1408163 RepID=A0A0F4YZT8_RASE3|nr:ADP-ribosylation factor family protein [Rasamsonia emersonii CBS 393.64]KKA23133.1 ADP-ribosylation factor family protein [Rasamsonia emersonii CBS 393.64]